MRKNMLPTPPSCCFRCLIFLGFVIFFAPLMSQAEAGTLIFESTSLTVSPSESKKMGAVIAAMKKNGFVAVPKTVGKLLPSAPLHDVDPDVYAATKEKVDRANRAWYQNNLDDAQVLFRAALIALRRDPVLLAEIEGARDLYFRSLVTLALVHHHQRKNESCKDVLQEILRDFPNRTVDPEEYGPKAVKLLAKATKNAPQKVSLVIKLDVTEATLFLNGRNIGKGSQSIEVAPGNYTLYAKSGKNRSSLHQVTVSEGSSASAEIRFIIESTLHLGKQYMWLQFPNDKAQTKNEFPLAKGIANWFRFDQFVLVGFYSRWGERGIVGALYSVKNGKMIRSVYFPTETGEKIRKKDLRQIGEYLAQGKATAALRIAFDPYGKTQPKAQPVDSKTPTWVWIAAGVGAVALIGAIMYASDSDEKMYCPRGYLWKNGMCVPMMQPPGIGSGHALLHGKTLLWTGAATVLGAALYYWLDNRKDEKPLWNLNLSPDSAAVLFSSEF